jgi:flavodoxin
MQALIVYDSQFGNTAQIARAVGEGIGAEARVVNVTEITAAELTAAELLIVGAPTHGGRPTPPVQEIIKAIPRHALKGHRASAFDTRISAKWVGIFGYAAGRIGKALLGKGADLIVNPEPFFVTQDKTPTLVEGELERAKTWGESLARQ